MQIAERNRLIKKVLTKEFAPATVTVRGSRGTAYGWVSIKVDKRPADREQRDAWKARVWELFEANKIEIGSYGYDDPGSDYGHGSTMNLDFARCLDEFTDGERVTWEQGGKVGTIVDPNYRNPGWYMVQWDDAEPGKPEEFYKRDLKAWTDAPAKPRVRVKAGRRVIDAAEDVMATLIEAGIIPRETFTPGSSWN